MHLHLEIDFLIKFFITRWIILLVTMGIVGEIVRLFAPVYRTWRTDQEIRKKNVYIPIQFDNRVWFSGFWFVFFLALFIVHALTLYDDFHQYMYFTIPASIMLSGIVVGLIRLYGYVRKVFALSSFAVVTFLLFPIVVKLLEPALVSIIAKHLL